MVYFKQTIDFHRFLNLIFGFTDFVLELCKTLKLINYQQHLKLFVFNLLLNSVEFTLLVLVRDLDFHFAFKQQVEEIALVAKLE